MSDLYFCPRAREMEIHPGGGFTVCCDRPELHIPVANGPMIPATVQLLDAANRDDYQAKQRVASLEADGDRLARAADDLARTLAATRERTEKAEAAIARVRALHIPARGGRSGYQPDDDDTPGAYGHIASACEECGSQDLAVRWPCPTIQALEQP